MNPDLGECKASVFLIKRNCSNVSTACLLHSFIPELFLEQLFCARLSQALPLWKSAAG